LKLGDGSFAVNTHSSELRDFCERPRSIVGLIFGMVAWFKKPHFRVTRTNGIALQMNAGLIRNAT
jgi:hypothetical protein